MTIASVSAGPARASKPAAPVARASPDRKQRVNHVVRIQVSRVSEHSAVDGTLGQGGHSMGVGLHHESVVQLLLPPTVVQMDVLRYEVQTPGSSSSPGPPGPAVGQAR